MVIVCRCLVHVLYVSFIRYLSLHSCHPLLWVVPGVVLGLGRGWGLTCRSRRLLVSWGLRFLFYFRVCNR